MKQLEMKICKECGKPFMPKSNKQKYCDELHYRPCPVCGKLVFAKYLSDPSRCCSGTCKSKLGKLNKEGKKPEFENAEAVAVSPEVVEYAKHDAETTAEVYDFNQLVKGTDKKKFAPASILTENGWKSNHEYATTLEHVDKEYIVKAVYDYTANEKVDLQYSFTNKKKISTVFKACR